MPTGTPYTAKCPKCMRGKWGHAPQTFGIKPLNEWRERFVQRCRRRGRTMVYERRAQCLDCGHVWWSSTVMGARRQLTKLDPDEV